jgi:hypothetical protein
LWCIFIWLTTKVSDALELSNLFLFIFAVPNEELSKYPKDVCDNI